jgi:hypothetical protein
LLKHTTIELLTIAVASTVFLYLTVLFDKKEYIGFYGEKYNDFKKRGKMFMPFIM